MFCQPCCGSLSNWQRDSKPLLTNFDNMYQPCVVEVGGEWRYRMWFFGWALAEGPRVDAIYHARSMDLKHWEVYTHDGGWDSTMNPNLWQAVLKGSTRWYDNGHNGDPSVVFKDGNYYMAYSACGKPLDHPVVGYPNGMILCVMGATSDDGIHWTKTGAPLLIRPEDKASPRPESQRVGDFNRPCLMWDRNRWRLWFDYWIPGKGVVMGYAENTGDFGQPSGFKLQHDLEHPIMENWVNPEIIRVDGRYYAFGDPPGYPLKTVPKGPARAWMSRQIREAVSDDGIHWTKLDYIAPDPDADACHVPQALVTQIDGRRWIYLFYATQTGFRRGDGYYHFQYDRIRAMRQPLP